MTFRRSLLGWTGLALLAWLVLSAIAVDDQGPCLPTDWICIDPVWFWLIVGVYVGVIWLLGTFAIAVVAGLARWHRKLSDEP